MRGMFNSHTDHVSAAALNHEQDGSAGPAQGPQLILVPTFPTQLALEYSLLVIYFCS